MATIIAADLLNEQKTLINDFFQNVSAPEAEAFFTRCASVEGSFILSGVGKSGIIAEKIATTLVSTGTKARYISQASFLHGDIGVLEEKDVVLLLSKSGESLELLDLLPHIQKRGCQVFALTSSPESALAKRVDFHMHLPVTKELCPFDLAPTISSEVQLMFGDLLAMALLHRKGFTLANYAENHPAGSIGLKATLKVADLMITGEKLPLASPDDLLIDRIVDLSEGKCGALLIEKAGKLEGIFTDGDLRRALQDKGAQVMQSPLKTIMTKNPLTTTPDTLAFFALKQMQEKRFVTVLPVLDQERLIGIIRMHDIIHA